MLLSFKNFYAQEISQEAYEIYGHSRGDAAAVRIANVLGDMNIHVAEVNLFDPVSLGGDFIFTHPNVLRVNNYYQRNSSDLLSKGLLGADNPFLGSPVKAKFSFPIINQLYRGELQAWCTS